MNTVSFADDGIRRNYRMSRQEYAFRTEGGNLSRTSLYGAGDLKGINGSMSTLKPGQKNISMQEQLERKYKRKNLRGTRLPRMQITNEKIMNKLTQDIRESTMGSWDKEQTTCISAHKSERKRQAKEDRETWYTKHQTPNDAFNRKIVGGLAQNWGNSGGNTQLVGQ